MGERLTNKDRDQIENWIGTGPKTFTLLYAISRDGCDAKIFHQKCDGQGPTLTVLYNEKESVYGGYSPISWNSKDNSYGSSTDTFLFQLYYEGESNTTKFELRADKYMYSVYNCSTYGPTFGIGYDLHTFKSSVNRSGSHFPLNGYTKFGKTYEMQGVNADQITNGNLNVTELEVYKVTYDKHKVGTFWRESADWNTKLLEKIKREILAFKPLPDLCSNGARIALIGPVDAGKSSFFNTVDSIFRGRITHRACSGSTEQSITEEYIPYSIRTESGDPTKITLCDTPGIEEAAGMDEDECSYLLDGNMPNFYHFNKESSSPHKFEQFGQDPNPKDRIHCVVFVLDATTLDALSSKVVQKMKNFQHLMNKREIPQVIILTKVDKLSKDVENDVSFTYKSWIVEDHVEKASQLLGIRQSDVLPIKNYRREAELDINVDILTLLCLRKVLGAVEDCMHNLLDRQKFSQENKNEK